MWHAIGLTAAGFFICIFVIALLICIFAPSD